MRPRGGKLIWVHFIQLTNWHGRIVIMASATETQSPGRQMRSIASAEIRVELYKIGLLRTINTYFLLIETFP